MADGCIMMSPLVCYAPSTTTGTTQSEHLFSTRGLVLNINIRIPAASVRRGFKAGDSKYDINRSFFHRCLYNNEIGDPSNVESGFLKGPLLLKVCGFHNDSTTGTLILSNRHSSTSLLRHLLWMPSQMTYNRHKSAVASSRHNGQL